jgi:hypothetical protein
MKATISQLWETGRELINFDGDEFERPQSFADLKKYRQTHPDMLLIAAHPNFGLGESLGMKRLKKYWNLFDAVENSWFYTKYINLNSKIQKLAQEKNKPYIATADLPVHF